MKKREKHFPLPEGFKLDSKGRFNKKPLSHWQDEAALLVADRLLRAANTGDSIIGVMASARLMAIAKQEDAEALKEVEEEKALFQKALAGVLVDDEST